MRAPSSCTSSAAPALDARPRLPCLAMVTPAPAVTKAEVVETSRCQSIATCADDVEGIDVGWQIDQEGVVEHGLRQTSDLLSRLPLGPQGGEEGCRLHIADLAVHDEFQHSGCHTSSISSPLAKRSTAVATMGITMASSDWARETSKS